MFYYHVSVQPFLEFLHNADTSASRTCAVITVMSELVQNGTSSPCRLVSLNVGSGGGNIPCSSAGPAPHATIQWLTKSQNISPHCHLHRRITMTHRGFHALKPWKRSQFLQERVPLRTCSHHKWQSFRDVQSVELGKTNFVAGHIIVCNYC